VRAKRGRRQDCDSSSLEEKKKGTLFRYSIDIVGNTRAEGRKINKVKTEGFTMTKPQGLNLGRKRYKDCVKTSEMLHNSRSSSKCFAIGYKRKGLPCLNG
jgi:hypothetical protein